MMHTAILSVQSEKLKEGKEHVPFHYFAFIDKISYYAEDIEKAQNVSELKAKYLTYYNTVLTEDGGEGALRTKEQIINHVYTELNNKNFGIDKNDLFAIFSDALEQNKHVGQNFNFATFDNNPKINFPLKEEGYYVSGRYPYYKQDMKEHDGIDFAYHSGKGGQTIYATEGIVTFVGQDNAGGNTVIIKTPQYSVTYVHMSNPSKLMKGQKVTSEDIVGYVGTTGNSTGNHLHIEFRDNNGTTVSPYYVLGLYT